MKKIIILIFLQVISHGLAAQFNYKIDTVFFKNEYVSSVSLGLDKNVWVIKNQNAREIGMVNNAAQALDLSSSFQSYTPSDFTDILGLDNLTALVATSNDYIVKYKTGSGFTHLDQSYGLENPNVNSLVYVKNTLSYMFYNYGNYAHGVMVGTNNGLYSSQDFTNFSRFTTYGGYINFNAKCRARYSCEGYTVFDLDSVNSRSIGYYDKINYIVDDVGLYGNNYSYFPSLPVNETVNSVIVADVSSSHVIGSYIYWGGDKGMKKKVWGTLTQPITYIPERNVYKLYELTYFPNSVFREYYMFLGTDSGLYCNQADPYGTDILTLVPNTSQYKIMDIDGSICDNSLWLATDKGLVRILLNFTPGLSINKGYIQNSLNPKGPITICKTDNVSFHTYSGVNYEWLKNGIPILGEDLYSYQTNLPGNYQVVLSADFCNFHISDTTFATEIQYDSAVNFTFIYPDTVHICEGETYVLGVNTQGGYTYEWYKNGLVTSQSLSHFSVTETGFYKVKAFNCAGIYKFSDSVFVNVHTIPDPVIHYSSQLLCAGDSLELSVDLLPFQISWFHDGFEMGSFRNRIDTYVYSSGIYTVQYADSFHCKTISSPLTLLFNPIPDLTIQANKSIPICKGDSVQLKAVTSASLYHWSTGSNSASIYTGIPGAYKVSVTSQQGCVNDDSIHIFLISNPSVDLGPDTSFCEGDLIPIVLKGGAGLSVYVWNHVFTKDSVFYAYTAGTYVVTVYNADNCSASDTIFINNHCIPLVFPNLITPNGDSKNETFYIENLIPQCSLTISNRWGNLIYNSYNYKNDWNGGSHADGVYYYVLKSGYYKQEWKGWVEIMK